MDLKKYDTAKNDPQATAIEPLGIPDFCFDSYREYESRLAECCRAFMEAETGVLVYRRMRVAEVFSHGCRDMKKSLEWQLGALKKSMEYEADVPNFLEPWYGIGPVAGAFDIDYIWNPGQAPATRPKFKTIDEALAYDIKPVKESAAGAHTLRMIEYFLDKTKGLLPVSMSDVQSPFNISTCIVDTSSFLLSLVLEPEKVLQFLDLLADLEIDFYREQERLIGDALVKPGHGFASSRVFEGIGMSDDNVVMVDKESYMNHIRPSLEKLGKAFGGPVFHSCGNYAQKAYMLTKIHDLRMVDAAFTAETDPNPNPAKPFREALSHSGIQLNARMVGNPAAVLAVMNQLVRPGMRIVAVTYASSPEEQKEVYRGIHSLLSRP